MKLTRLILLATSCHSVLSSSTTSLHQKNVFDKDIDDVGSLISQYHEINGFHLLDRQQDVGVASDAKFHPLKQERQMVSEIPTFSPTAVPTAGDGGDGAVVIDTEPEGVASKIPTFYPTAGEVDNSVPVDGQTFAPTLVSKGQSYAPTMGGTPTVAFSKTLYPTIEDGYIDTTEVETEEPHTPNWYPYTSLTSDQFNKCQSDLIASDTNQDSRLSMSEYLNFLSLYSQSTNSKTVSPNTMNDVPYEFSLIFHTTSCQCAYLGEGEGCCIGDKEGVRIFSSTSSGQTTGGGSSTTIDVGGGENDDVDTGGAIITTDDTSMEDPDAVIDAISVIEDSYWDELPFDIQYAYTVLGYNQTSWDNGIPVPVDEMTWDELSSAMKGAALSIGYTQEIWDQSKRRKMKRFENAMQLFGEDLRIVGGTNIEEDSGIGAMLDEETYTKNFCTDVYNAYKVTKPPTYAPSTEAPSESKVATEAPTASLATEPTSPFPTTTESSPTSLPPVTTSPVTTTDSKSPTYYPTMRASNPPMDAPTTSMPIDAPSPVTPAPSVTTTSLTSTPTSSLTLTKAPSITDDNILPIFLSYGISSNCGITAIDVLEANENTIMEGLIAATEVLVVEILNSTFPRDDGSITMRKKIFHQTYAEMYASGAQLNENALTKRFIDNDFKMVKSQPDPIYLEMAQPNDWKDGDRKLAYLEGASQNHRNLVYWTSLYPVEITDVEDVLNQACPAGVNCMKVFSTVNVVLEEGDSAQEIEDAIKDGVQTAFSDGTFFQNIPPDTIFCPGETAPPFTNTNPPAPETSAPVSSPDTNAPTTSSTVAETESATSPPTLSTAGSNAPIDVTPMPTSPGFGVESIEPTTRPTVAETGSITSPPTLSNADASTAPSEKVESSTPTTSLVVELSTDAPIMSPTISETSPPTPIVAVTTNVPTVASSNGAATSSPVQGEITTAVPSLVAGTASPAAGEAITSSPSVGDTSGSTSPVAEGGETSSTSPPTSGATNIPPWALPDKTDSATTMPTSSSIAAPLGNLVVDVTYDIANDCGLDSQAIMNEVNNTLKLGLIAATTTTTISILNETYPRADDDSRRQLQYNTQYLRYGDARTLIRLNSLDRLSQLTNHRNLVYYTDELPVTIDNVIDVTDGCAAGNNCLLVQSSITTVLEDGDDSDEIKSALEDGIRDSFTSGTFFEAIPNDTVICP